MKISVKLFANLSPYARVTGLPGTPFTVELPQGACLQDLVDVLGIPTETVKITFINGIIHSLDQHLADGDEVGIFPPIGGGSLADMLQIDVWLYGNLSRYGGEADQKSHAHLMVSLPAGSSMADLLAAINMPTAERGITFINGDLSAMPGLQPDLPHKLVDGDRVAFFHLTSMWPFQYRHGVAMIDEMSSAMQTSPDQGIHHTYAGPSDEVQ